jgi:hypothetical protein
MAYERERHVKPNSNFQNEQFEAHSITCRYNVVVDPPAGKNLRVCPKS